MHSGRFAERHGRWRRDTERSIGGGILKRGMKVSWTQVEYCVKHGLSTKSFYRWRRKEKDAVAAGQSALTLVPVTMNTPVASSSIRLHSPGGWRIELGGGSVSWLAELLRRLP